MIATAMTGNFYLKRPEREMDQFNNTDKNMPGKCNRKKSQVNIFKRCNPKDSDISLIDMLNATHTKLKIFSTL
jgi:hypothetical protein